MHIFASGLSTSLICSYKSYPQVHSVQCPLDSQGNTNNTMKLLGLALLIASASAFDLSKLRLGLAAPPTEIEYGFCGEFSAFVVNPPFLRRKPSACLH